MLKMFLLFIQAFSYEQSEPLLAQLMSVPSHSPTVHVCEELGTSLVSPSKCRGAAAFPTKAISASGWTSLSPHRVATPASSHHSGSVLNFFKFVTVCFRLGAPKLGQCFSCGLRSAEQRGIIPFLSMLALCLWMQPRRLLTIFAARVLLAHLIAQ